MGPKELEKRLTGLWGPLLWGLEKHLAPSTGLSGLAHMSGTMMHALFGAYGS